MLWSGVKSCRRQLSSPFRLNQLFGDAAVENSTAIPMKTFKLLCRGALQYRAPLKKCIKNKIAN